MDIEIICNTDDDVLFANIKANSRAKKWVKEIPAHDGHAIIVGGGPSLADFIPSIQQRIKLGQKVFALNGAAKFLNKCGIVPDYQVILDARPENVALIGKAKCHLISSQCDPALFEKVQNVKVWHPAIENIEDHLPDYDDEFALIGGGTTVGLSAMCLVYAMGYRFLHLYGYDSSNRQTFKHAYEQPINTGEPMCKVTMAGKVFTSSFTMARQAELFPEVCNNLIDLGCVITVDSDGLIMAVMEEMRKHAEPISEDEKYCRMWSIDSYRHMSPGENFSDEFIELAKIDEDSRVIDFGCGSGRGGKAIYEKTGCGMLLVDFADNCLDKDNYIAFEIADLTKPMKLESEFGYCTDVMEHIPPELVEDTIKNIMSCVSKCFFKIAMFEDNMGKLIGHPLHLSVFSGEWWQEKFSDYKILYQHYDKDTAFPYATLFVQTKERP